MCYITENLRKRCEVKGLRKAAAVFLAMALMLAMPLAVYGEAIIDEDGNIIEENVELEGGIITLGADIETGATPPAHPGFGSFAGVVFECGIEGILAVEGPDGDVVHFYITYQTYFPHGEPAIGDFVIGFYDMSLPAVMIYPPRFAATAIVIVDEEPPFYTVARFGLDNVSECSAYRLVIYYDTPIFLQDGQVIVPRAGERDDEGGVLWVALYIADEYPIDTSRIMLVEYSIAHRDYMPTTIFPDRITVLWERIVAFPEPIDEDYLVPVPLPYELEDEYMEIVPLPYELEDEYEPVVGVDWSLFDVAVDLGDALVGVEGVTTRVSRELAISGMPSYVSLAAFVRFFGEEVNWHGSRRAVSFTWAGDTFEIAIDSADITISWETGEVSVSTMGHAPFIVGGTTYVHVSFFGEVLGFDDAFYHDGLLIFFAD